MKNKIVTLLCILAILITTAIVALADDRQTYDINAASVEGVNVVQNMQKKTADGTLVEVDNSDIIYPVVGEKNALDRITTVTNNTIVEQSADPSVYVRTVFAFEAADLKRNEFHDVMYIKLNQGVDPVTKETANWAYPADNDWIPMTYNGQNYYMLVATYNKALGFGSTEASLLQVGFESDAASNILARFGNTYEMMATTQAVSVSANAQGTAAADALNARFGVISSTNHPWLPKDN